MATRVMVVWILVLQVFWAGVYVLFSRHFDGANLERARVAILERKLHMNVRTMARLEMDFSEYKDAIAAAGIKINDKTSWTDSKRMIASVMADPQFKSIPLFQPGSAEFKRAKKIFVSGDPKRASEVLDQFVQDYPDSPDLPEALYLLGESYYGTDDLEDTVKTIDMLVTHFPETEFAGYGLVRLATIFNKEDRPDEAGEIYDAVVRNFPKSNAAAIAEKNKKDLNL